MSCVIPKVVSRARYSLPALVNGARGEPATHSEGGMKHNGAGSHFQKQNRPGALADHGATLLQMPEWVPHLGHLLYRALLVLFDWLGITTIFLATAIIWVLPGIVSEVASFKKRYDKFSFRLAFRHVVMPSWDTAKWRLVGYVIVYAIAVGAAVWQDHQVLVAKVASTQGQVDELRAQADAAKKPVVSRERWITDFTINTKSGGHKGVFQLQENGGPPVWGLRVWMSPIAPWVPPHTFRFTFTKPVILDSVSNYEERYWTIKRESPTVYRVYSQQPAVPLNGQLSLELRMKMPVDYQPDESLDIVKAERLAR